MKRELGEIWKEDGEWKIQLPKGIWTTRTKSEAAYVSDIVNEVAPKSLQDKVDEVVTAVGEFIDAKISYELSYRDDPEYCCGFNSVCEASGDLSDALMELLK